MANYDVSIKLAVAGAKELDRVNKRTEQLKKSINEINKRATAGTAGTPVVRNFKNLSKAVTDANDALNEAAVGTKEFNQAVKNLVQVEGKFDRQLKQRERRLKIQRLAQKEGISFTKAKILLAKQEAEEFRIKQAEQLKEVLVAQRRQLYFNLPGNAAKEVQTTSYSTERDDLSKDLLNELKSIETKINDIMLNLDLDKRLDLTKNIVQDIFKSNAFQKKEIDPKYDNLNFQINNQRKMLEELLKYSNKYTSY